MRPDSVPDLGAIQIIYLLTYKHEITELFIACLSVSNSKFRYC